MAKLWKIKISKNVEKFVPEKINLFIAKQFDNSFIENKFEASKDSPALITDEPL